jgi:uncharacterized protein DUF4128
MAGALENVREGLFGVLQTFIDLPANSALSVKWPNLTDEPAPPSVYLEPTLFIDPTERVAVGSAGTRRDSGRLHINVHGPINAGLPALDTIVERLLVHFDPKATPTITEGTTIIRIGPTLPYTVEPVTDGPWRTKPFIVPWFCDTVPA